MLGGIAAFEFRYQIRSPLFGAAASLFFVAALVDMSIAKLLTSGGGNVLFNSPHAIIMFHLLASLVFLFVGAAFVSNVIVRDDQTGFGPLVRSTRITKFDYLFGRFLGAFAVGALVMAAVPFGEWLGTLMPFANHEMLGPNRLAGYAYGYGLFALPNALIVSALLFTLATATRSIAGTFVGVLGLLVLYLLSQGMMAGRPALATVRVLADPLGMSAYLASSRYFTASELNAGAVPIDELLISSRLLWTGASIGLLALAYRLFRFSDRGMSRRRRARGELTERPEPSAPSGAGAGHVRLPAPRFDRRAARRQFLARAGMEARYIFTSPVFLMLLVVAFAFALPSLLTASGVLGMELYPVTFVLVPLIEESFRPILILVAAYYAGELAWRERERHVHEIIDAAPLPPWALMLPKILGLALVLFTTLLVGVAVAILIQLVDGAVEIAPRDYLLWSLLPGVVDAVLIAVLAVFVQLLSPSKYAGWGVMVLYIVIRLVGPSVGLEHPLILYGSVPDVPLSDIAGSGIYWKAAWWFRGFWAATAALLLIAGHLLWRRGADPRLKPRVRRLPARLTRRTGLLTAAATALLLLSGSWIVYNTVVANDFRSSAATQRYQAEVERRYFRYAGVPQPTVRHVELDVALYPEDVRADVHGRYRLVNETGSSIDRVHVRLLDRDLILVDLDFPATQLERSDDQFGYRIYRLDAPMRPGEERWFTFHARRQQVGFRAVGTEMGLAPNGTSLTTFDLAPRIGMSDIGLLEEPAARRGQGLPARRPFPRLDDLEATKVTPGGDLSWTTADITVSTSADQTPIAPGKRVSERVEHGRRIARFVSDAPIRNFFLIQSGRYASRTDTHGGVEYTVYFQPAHHWNVDRMMTAMQAAIAYCNSAFGPYQFDHAQIVERPAYWDGAQAFPDTLAFAETVGFATDLRDAEAFDAVTMITAHELAHQWWGHQVLGARMQGASLVSETLAQYSALMVTKQLRGEDRIGRFLRFQLDRYLGGRRTQVLEEEPLVSVDVSQDYIAYGKGALVLYLLQQRMGEAAVNRALRAFVDKYRFTDGPYPRSLDLVKSLRAEAAPDQQALITDLFERITVYDLKVDTANAVRRADGAWDVTVQVDARKFHADGTGTQHEAPLSEPIEIGLFTAPPGDGAFDRNNVIRLERHELRSGTQVFHFVTDERPTHAGVDPFNAYIDRNAGDNVGSVTGALQP